MWKKIFKHLLGCILVLATAPAVASEAATLEEPPEIRGDVIFWERVFGHYQPNDCVLHDRDNLNIIYAVKRLPAGSKPKDQSRLVKYYLKLLKQAMLSLAANGKPTTRLEQRVWDVTEDRLRHKAYWRYASENVRCQRGVDISASVERAKPHIPMVMKLLNEHGLPQDLAYLPLLESGYERMAHSRAGARGIWQLMPETARLNGLRVSRRLDQRIDPHKSTEAAVKLLSEFYQRTNSWALAITAYNYGINGTERAVKLHGSDYLRVRDQHQSPIFGFAAKNYYPSFLAVRNVVARSDVAMNQAIKSRRM